MRQCQSASKIFLRKHALDYASPVSVSALPSAQASSLTRRPVADAYLGDEPDSGAIPGRHHRAAVVLPLPHDDAAGQQADLPLQLLRAVPTAGRALLRQAQAGHRHPILPGLSAQRPRAGPAMGARLRLRQGRLRPGNGWGLLRRRQRRLPRLDGAVVGAAAPRRRAADALAATEQ